MSGLTPEQIRRRIGYFTASRANDAFAVLKTGRPSEARTKYMMELVAERMCDVAAERYVTDAMQFGTEFEDAAKTEFEVETGELILPADFIEHPSIEWLGATPDGFLNDDACIEFKVPSSTTYASWLAAGVVPEQHKNQMLVQLACTGRSRCQFVAFNPRVVRGPRLFMRWFCPDQDEIMQAEHKAAQFLQEVEELFEKVTTMEVA